MSIFCSSLAGDQEMGVERGKRKGREVKENSALYNHEMFHALETHEKVNFFPIPFLREGFFILLKISKANVESVRF
jgi:hypothetical protein